jgi:hypothetical protein
LIELLRRDLKEIESRMTIRLGTMLAAADLVSTRRAAQKRCFMTNGVKKPPLSAGTERFLAKGRGEIPSLGFTGDYAVEWATSIHNRDAALKKYGKDREEAKRLALVNGKSDLMRLSRP